MEPLELLALASSALERLAIEYLVTGSMATIAYGELRFTNDIDIVVRLLPASVDDFTKAFPAPEFYISRIAIEEAVRAHRQFNVIHPASGLKIDFFVASPVEFDQMRFARVRRLPVFKHGTATFAAPEDVILKKLIYYREGGSEKHVRDILGVMRVLGNSIDLDHIAQWAKRLGVQAEWESVLQKFRPDSNQ